MALAMQQQVEYYLSEENLSEDKYLQSIMDPSGWIPLKSIVACPRMQQLHATTALVAGALRFSSKVDVSQDERRVRVRKWRRCSRKTSPSRAGPVRAAKRPSPILASLGHPAPAADSTPPRMANAQVVMLELSAIDGRLRVLLQLRSKLMPVMPGHLATVGGCRDRTDPDSRYTGMREAVEETGLTGGLMYPPVKFAEGPKVDWFAMQLQSPQFGGKLDLGELDDVRTVLDQLPPSAQLAENFGHVWLPVSKLDDIDPSMKLMGGMLFKIRQAASHLSLPDAGPAAGQAPTKAAMAATAAHPARAACQEDIDALQAEIESAEHAADVQLDALHQAQERVSDLRERAKRRIKAKEALEMAGLQADIDALGHAIAMAQISDVDAESIARATDKLQRLRNDAEKRTYAKQALDCATRGSDIAVLVRAIGQAELIGIDELCLREASERLQVLTDEAQKRRERVEALLREAVDGSCAEALMEAVAQATGLEVGMDLLNCAKAKLKQVQEAIQRKTAAEEALAKGLQESDPGRLAEAIESALDAGADERLVGYARSRLGALQEEAQRRQEVQESLTSAAAKEDVQTLTAAIARAVEFGFSRESLKESRKVLDVLKKQEQKMRKMIDAALAMAAEAAAAEDAAEAAPAEGDVELSSEEEEFGKEDSNVRAGPAPAAQSPCSVLASLGHPAPAADSTPPRKANAQVVMLEKSTTDGRLRVLLQLRSKLMPVMPGHLATVGGCRDRIDPDSRYTGMREAVEETGLTGGLMYPPVKFAEGAKVDWFAMQLQSPEFGGKQGLGELDDVRPVLDQLPPSAQLAENFGHVWLPVSELDDINPSMKLMGGMLFKIRQAASHLSLLDAGPVAGHAPTKAAVAAEVAAAEDAAEAATAGGDVELSSEEEEEYGKDEKRVRVQR